jgi:hypothetical protein
VTRHTPSRRARKAKPADSFGDVLGRDAERDQADNARDRDRSELDEFRDALADFTNYSTNNETAEALAARDRLDRAEANRRRRFWRF